MTSKRVERLADALDGHLRAAGDPDRAVNEKRYLKSSLQHYGANVPAVRKAVRVLLRDTGELPHASLLELVDRLWSTGLHEHRMAAVVLLQERASDLLPSDLPMLERFVRTSETWAYADSLAAHAVGSVVERHPELLDELDRWAGDEDFWVRRSAMLALLGPLREGKGQWRRFKRYADSMLHEKEFFIRKAIGWVLRERSKERPDQVRDYVASRVDRMAGLTFREATKHLPDQDRRALRAAFDERT